MNHLSNVFQQKCLSSVSELPRNESPFLISSTCLLFLKASLLVNYLFITCDVTKSTDASAGLNVSLTVNLFIVPFKHAGNTA